MTLNELYDLYMGIYRCERSDAVSQNYRWNMCKYILNYIGGKDISEITLSEVQMLLNNMRGKSATTIRSVYGDIKLIFRHAYIDEYICRDFAPLLTKPKCLKGGFRRALTPLERATVIEVAQTDQRYLGFLFMMLCGCRPSEAYAMEKEDLDYENETCHIRGTKTELSDRIVPCPRIILGLAEKTACGLLILSQTGLRVTKENQGRIWKSFFTDCHKHLGGKMYRNAPAAPFPFGRDLTPYNLRHEYCTNLARNGVDVRITQKLMGHASPEMTLRVYTNLSNEDICTDQVRAIVNNLQACARLDSNV